MIKAGGKLAVFPAPADKAVVEAVYGCRILQEKTHVAAFNRFHAAACEQSRQQHQAAAADGGVFLHDALRIERRLERHGQGRRQQCGGGGFGQQHAAALHPTPFPRHGQVVGNKFGMQHHVAVDEHDVRPLRRRQCAVARLCRAEALVFLPNVFDRYRGGFCKPPNRFRSVRARAVVGDDDFRRRYGLLQNGL